LLARATRHEVAERGAPTRGTDTPPSPPEPPPSRPTQPNPHRPPPASRAVGSTGRPPRPPPSPPGFGRDEWLPLGQSRWTPGVRAARPGLCTRQRLVRESSRHGPAVRRGSEPPPPANPPAVADRGPGTLSRPAAQSLPRPPLAEQPSSRAGHST